MQGHFGSHCNVCRCSLDYNADDLTRLCYECVVLLFSFVSHTDDDFNDFEFIKNVYFVEYSEPVELSRFSTDSYANLPMTSSRNSFFFRTQILVSRFDVVVIISTKKWKYFINAFDDATPTFVSIVRTRCKASSKTKTISSIRRFSSSWSQSISKSKYYCYWIEIVRITSAHTNTFSVHRTVFVSLQCLFHLLCLCQNKRAQNLFVFWILSIRNYTTFQL